MKRNSNSYFIKFEDLKEEIKNACQVFVYLPEKDIFINEAKDLMTKRLIENSTIDYQLEKYLIEKISGICGNENLSSIDKMIDEITSSEQLSKQYSEWKSNNGKLTHLNFEIKLLSELSFNTQINPNFVIPNEIINEAKYFTKFFKELPQNAHKELKWKYEIGNLEIGLHFQGKDYIIKTNIVQGLILLLLNENLSLTLSKIHKILNISDEIIQK